MTQTKFVVKVLRGGTQAIQYVQRVYPTPVQMTLHIKQALVMGRFAAEDVVKSVQNSRRNAELVSVQVRPPEGFKPHVGGRIEARVGDPAPVL